MKAFFHGLLALVVLAAACVGLAIGARKGLGWLFDGVDPTIAAAIVAAAATTLVSVLGVTVGRYLERRHQIDLELRQRKVPMYTEFVEGLLTAFNSSGDDEDASAKNATLEVSPPFDLLAFFRRITPQLMIWASNDVVVKWSRFRRGADKHPPMEYMFMMEDLLVAIRKDLGHSGDMTKGDLLGLYVNDIDEYVTEKK